MARLILGISMPLDGFGAGPTTVSGSTRSSWK
jgi:hypothetical protein